MEHKGVPFRFKLRVGQEKFNKYGLFESLAHLLHGSPKYSEVVRNRALGFICSSRNVLNLGPGDGNAAAAAAFREINSVGHWNIAMEIACVANSYGVKIQMVYSNQAPSIVEPIPPVQGAKTIRLQYGSTKITPVFGWEDKQEDMYVATAPEHHLPSEAKDQRDKLERDSRFKLHEVDQDAANFYRSVALGLTGVQTMAHFFQTAALVEVLRNRAQYEKMLDEKTVKDLKALSESIRKPNGRATFREFKIMANATGVILCRYDMDTHEKQNYYPLKPVAPTPTLRIVQQGSYCFPFLPVTFGDKYNGGASQTKETMPLVSTGQSFKRKLNITVGSPSKKKL